MATLPTVAALTGATTTNDQQKQNLTDWRTWCADLLGTDSSNKAAARAALGAYPATGGLVDGRVMGKANTVAYTAGPVFDASLGNLILFGALTGNVTSMTITNPVQGHFLSIRFKQDAAGGRTVALPAGAKVAGSVGTLANQASYLNLTYISADARWEGAWTVLPV